MLLDQRPGGLEPAGREHDEHVAGKLAERLAQVDLAARRAQQSGDQGACVKRAPVVSGLPVPRAVSNAPRSSSHKRGVEPLVHGAL